MSAPGPMEVPAVTCEEVDALAPYVLLDVRELDEWRVGHAPEARHLPLGQLAAAPQQLDTTDRVVVICRSGARSARATAALRDWGFDAVNLAGGMQAWAASDRPVITDDGTAGGVA